MKSSPTPGAAAIFPYCFWCAPNGRRLLPTASCYIAEPDILYIDLNQCAGSYDPRCLEAIPLAACETPHTSVIRNGLLSRGSSLNSVFTSILKIFERFSAGKVYENFFQDILHRRVTNTILIQQQITVFNWDINDTYSVLVIDVTGQPADRIQFLINYYDGGADNCRAFENGCYVICICHMKSIRNKAQFSQKTGDFLMKLNLKGALSKTFTSFCDMDLYYRQAVTILRFCMKNEPKRFLFLKEDFGLYGIFHAALENHNAYELCHPDIITLYEYDRKNDTEYLETLHQYLLCDRNAVKAAKNLYIHRNTMSYRLQKLKSMVSFDEEDTLSRFYIMNSISLLKFQLKRPEELQRKEHEQKNSKNRKIQENV